MKAHTHSFSEGSDFTDVTHDHRHEPRTLLEDENGAPYPHFVQAAAHAAEWMEGVRQMGNDLAEILKEGIDAYSADWPERARAAIDRWNARTGR